MMMKGIPFIAIALSILATACQTAVAPQETGKPRTIVTTDGECDDYDSFIRLLLYANDLDIDAIVYSALSVSSAIPETKPSHPDPLFWRICAARLMYKQHLCIATSPPPDRYTSRNSDLC